MDQGEVLPWLDRWMPPSWISSTTLYMNNKLEEMIWCVKNAHQHHKERKTHYLTLRFFAHRRSGGCSQLAASPGAPAGFTAGDGTQ